MREIFEVSIAAPNEQGGRYTHLSLPATPYEMLDGLEKIRVTDPADAVCEVEKISGFPHLIPFLDERQSLCGLNALAQRLSELDEAGKMAFEGLLKVEVKRRRGPIDLPQLIDLAYNTGRCHVVAEIKNDAQLGRFCTENGFLPEVDTLPDKVYELLDFEKIGREWRTSEGGVFTELGYVVPHSEPEQVTETLDLRLRKPSYAIRITADRYPYEGEAQHEWKHLSLELPADQAQVDSVLRELDVPNWGGVVITGMDSPIPGLEYDPFAMGGISMMNELAQKIQTLEQEGKLSLFKALLEAKSCSRATEALRLADTVDEYLLSESVRTATEVALEELKVIVDKDSAARLARHLNLPAYGNEVLEWNNAVLTQYGLLERMDCQPIHTRVKEPSFGGMEL